jgi:hypothetical protein
MSYGKRGIVIRSDYEKATPDLLEFSPESVIPDISTVGMFGYPADFACEMPGYTGTGANIGGSIDGVPGASASYDAGSWSTPEAYAWGRSEALTTDPQIGGLPGDKYGIPFALGAVESNTVENFEMLGNQAVFQNPDVNNYGDVGFMDFGGRLASAVGSDTFDLANFYDSSLDILGMI